MSTDAEFIAYARDDVPALLSEVSRLRAELKEAQERIDAALAITTARPELLRGSRLSGSCRCYPRRHHEDDPLPCTCGWGGQHDPDNPRCQKNAPENSER